MLDTPAPATGGLDLRGRAARRLRRGGGPGAPSAGPVGPAAALAVLHTLASSPSTAADALAVLHELQVHQVELELQDQELRESMAQLEAALRRQLERYEAQPASCFTVDRGLVISELNRRAAQLLGLAPEAACGLSLEAFLDAASARGLRGAVAATLAGGAVPVSVPSLHWQPAVGAACRLRAEVGADPSGPQVLLIVTPAQDEHPAGPREP